MTPTLYVARLDGLGRRYLSLHTRRERAVEHLAAEARAAWVERFGYDLGTGLTPAQVVETVATEAYLAVDEVEVDLP